MRCTTGIAHYDWYYSTIFKEGLQLDRVDNNSNYCKENCRWATSYEQTRNQRSNVVIEYDGVRYVLVDLAKKLKIKPSTLYARHRRGANLFDKVVTRG